MNPKSQPVKSKIALINQSAEIQIQKGLQLFQDTVNSIGEFNNAIDKLVNFVMRILDDYDDEKRLIELEALVNDIFSKAKSVNDKAELFAKWAKEGWRETISDERLSLILAMIYRIRTYIDDTNIALENQVNSIKSWQSMQNNEKYESLLKRLFGIQSKHNIPEQEGQGAIQIYKNAVNKLIEAVRYRWPFNEILSILDHLKKTVAGLGNPQVTDFTKQIKRALAAKQNKL